MGKSERKNIRSKQKHTQLALITLSKSEPFNFLSVSYTCKTKTRGECP